MLNYASEHFGYLLPQVVYVQTVVSKNAAGNLVIRGMYVGDDAECFEHAARLSLQVNFLMMNREIHKAVVFLDPHEFRSTWLGNKSIYRTRMALADNAELIVLAPGVHEFGEDAAIDLLIRKYGYCGTPATLEAAKHDADLAGNLSAAAHLIHGSSEGRFTIRYCPGHLTRQEIEGVHFEYWRPRRVHPPNTTRTGSAMAGTWSMAKRSSSSRTRVSACGPTRADSRASPTPPACNSQNPTKNSANSCSIRS